jgi:hypothetical protein
MTHPIREAVAKAVGEVYDGYADPVDTPHNWRRAIVATDDAIAAMRPVIEAAYRAGYSVDHAEGSADYATRIIAELTGNPPKTP